MRKWLPAVLLVVTAAAPCAAGHIRKPLALFQVGEKSKVTGLAYSPDGKYVAVASASEGLGGGWYQGRVTLYDVATLKPVEKDAQLASLYGPVSKMAFSPDGKLLAVSGAADDKTTAFKTVELIDVETRKQARSVQIEHWVFDLAFSADSKALAVSGWGKNLGVFTVADGKTVALVGDRHDPFKQTDYKEKDERRLLAVAFSPDGKLVATGAGDGGITLWDAATLAKKDSLTGHTHEVHSVAFSPDGKWLASGSRDRTVRVWDVAKGKEAAVLEEPAGGNPRLAFLPGTNLLLSAGWGGTVRVWDVAEKRCNVQVSPSYAEAVALAVAPDGKTFVVATTDRSVKLYPTEGFDRPEPQPRYLPAGYVCQCVAQSADGKLLAAGHPTTAVMVWEAETGKVVKPTKAFGSRTRAVAFHPKDGTLYTGSGEDGVITIFDSQTGEKKGTLGKAERNSAVHTLQFLPDGKTLLAAGYTMIRFWDTVENKEIGSIKPPAREGGFTSCSLTPDGKYLAVAANYEYSKQPHGLTVYDVATRKELVTVRGLPNIALKAVALSPDGKTLVGAGQQYTLVGNFKDFKWGDGVVQFWDLDLGEKGGTGKLVETLKPEGLEPIWALTFTRDGKAVISGSDKRTAIRVYDPATRKELASYESGTNAVWGFTFSPDGKSLLAAVGGNSSNNSVQVWDVEKLTAPEKAPPK